MFLPQHLPVGLTTHYPPPALQLLILQFLPGLEVIGHLIVV
jgi:hypothetical protein